MGIKYEKKSVELVISTAESLKKATEHLTQVAVDMQQHGMKEAYFPWTKRQWDCLDVIITLAVQCVAALPQQILAKQQGRPSQYELIQKKSRRDIAARKARQAAGPAVPPRPRGRPRKNAE